MPKASLRTSAAACVLAAASVHTTHADAQQQPVPPLVQQLNNGNWLPQKEAESLRDELFYQHAVHAYMTMLPALNVIGIRDGSEATVLTVPIRSPPWRWQSGHASIHSGRWRRTPSRCSSPTAAASAST